MEAMHATGLKRLLFISSMGIYGEVPAESSSGIIYQSVVLIRARRQTHYRPEREDWLRHVVFPMGSYAALALGANLLTTSFETAMFAVGGAALAFLLIGIHNSWDAVTFHVVGEMERGSPSQTDRE